MALDDVACLKLCCSLIEEKLGWGPGKDWVNSDFKKLSEKIYTDSGILISPATLKRLFGKIKTCEQYNPQDETKKALANFLGYANWEAFKETHKGSDKPKTSDPPCIVTEEKAVPSFSGVHLNLIKYAGIAALGLVLFLSIGMLHSGDREDKKAALRVWPKIVKGNAPFTAVFDYDRSAIADKKVYVTFGYGGDQKEKFELPLDQKTITHWFSLPGHYQVKFYIDDEVAYQTAVHVLNNRWETEWISENHGAHNQLSFSDSLDGILTASETEYAKYMPQVGKKYWIRHSLIQDFKASGDDFSFETKLKVLSLQDPTACDDAVITILCERNDFQLHFLRPGCTKWVTLFFSEVQEKGGYKDLSVFGRDMRAWNTIRLRVKNNVAGVYFNDIKMYEVPFTQKLGAVKGIVVQSQGNNELDYVKLWDAQRNPVYFENFGVNTTMVTQ